jgi:hypothetical protein
MRDRVRHEVANDDNARHVPPPPLFPGLAGSPALRAQAQPLIVELNRFAAFRSCRS